MNNDQAMDALVAQRAAINGAINELNRYAREQGDWKAAVKTSQMAEVKSLGSSGGVDLASWDGTAAPVVVE